MFEFSGLLLDNKVSRRSFVTRLTLAGLSMEASNVQRPSRRLTLPRQGR
jgi:hypothetical protein